MILFEYIQSDDNLDLFVQTSKQIVTDFPQIAGINIPDITTLPIRSDEASHALLDNGIYTVPHFRCIDRPVDETISLLRSFQEKGVKEVLMVAGDQPDESVQTYPIRTPDLIRAIKNALPSLKVYSALDPYRQTLREEILYCEEKLEAGTDGFLTQPFFDLNLAKVYLDKLSHAKIFLGISPVLKQSTYRYWENRNNVIFPKNFSTDFQSNCQLGQDLFALANEYKQDAYIMPITTPPIQYLSGLFAS